MGLRDKLFAVVGLDRTLDAYVGRARNNAGLPEILTTKHGCSRSSTTR